VDEHGWFESVIGPAPSSWPWTFPHFFAINIAPDPGEEVTRALAKADGQYFETKLFIASRTRWELVAYWGGQYHVCEAMRLPDAEKARDLAMREFQSMPVRYLMEAGKVVRENPTVDLTGTWPRPVPLRGFRDLGVLCALVYQEASACGGKQAADDLKARLGMRWPASVMIGMYVQAIRDSLESLKPFLESRTVVEMENAIRTGREWIQPSTEDEV